MPLFMPDYELARLSSDAASITTEQKCSLLEHKYLSLSHDYSSLESENVKLQSDLDEHLSELAQSQAQKHQVQFQLIEKDGEVSRMKMEMNEMLKSKRQLMELLEAKDAEVSEKNSTIKSYLDKIVKLTDSNSEKESKFDEANAELVRSQGMCSRLSQEKEFIESHSKWLDEELTAKVDSYNKLHRRHSDLEAKLSDVERNYNESSSSLNWHKGRLRELETMITSLQEELTSCKDAAASSEHQYNAELFTANKLVELYKESSEEWSRKAGELEGVINALEARMNQVQSDYKDRLEKQVSTNQQLEKEKEELKHKLEKCTDEQSLVPLSSFTRRADDSEERQEIISKVPAGVSRTALAASLLRDGWSLAKIYDKYQEAVDALRHEQLGRKEAEDILQRILSEIKKKVGFIQEERDEHDRMVEAYSLVNQKLQDSVAEQTNMERYIMELKAELRRWERENIASQKNISDLQKQVTILLKECRDVQLPCGAARDDDDDPHQLSDVEMDMESEADRIISQLEFKDIKGLVEQNVKLRSVVRSLSDQVENREMERKEKFEIDLKNKTNEASSKVSIVLKRAEEQGQMIESLHTSVAFYKKLYEEEQKLHSSHSCTSDSPPVPGRTNFLDLLEDYTKRVQEKAFEHARSLEEDLGKARTEITAIRSERDKLALETSFAREKLESIMKESEEKREEMNNALARNIELSQLIFDHQRKLHESSESLRVAEEVSRRQNVEISKLEQEKEVLSNAEKRACDEVSALSHRVYRLQGTLDTIQSKEEVREEARAAERRKEEEHIKQLEREWAEAKRELQEERSNARNSTLDRNQTLNNAARRVDEMRKELVNTLKAVAAAESRASVAETRLSDLEKKIRSSDPKALDLDSAKEEIEKLRGEVESSKNHMLQYKSIAQVNETALNQMESANEDFRVEAEKRQKSLEAELVSLRERVSELENDCIQKSEQIATAAAGKEEALVSASAEISILREESLFKNSQIEAVKMQMSVLKNDLETEHEKWRVAQTNYERQVILQSETIQELTKTSQAFAALQEEASELSKVAVMLGHQKNLVEKKCHELNEQNKILHSRLEDQLEDAGLQSVVNYLRRSNEIAEREISLLRQEKLRLQSQLESAVKMAESARERASTRASLLTEDEMKSLQLQVNEINLLRESNMQLREENKYNFEECQRLRDVFHKARTESENSENQLKQKQTELDMCMREMERLRTETDLQQKRVDELLETCKNIDVADYNRLKDEVRQLEEKLKAKGARIEDFKKVMLEKQNKISLVETERDEKEQKVQTMEKVVHQLRETVKRKENEIKKKDDELAKEKTERKSIVLNSQASAKSTDMVTEPATASPATAITRASPSRLTTQQPPKASLDNKEKRVTAQKPSTGLCRLGRPGKRIVRPQLVKPEEQPPQGEAGRASTEGKQPSSHETVTLVPPVQMQVRKRREDSLAPETRQETQGEPSSEIAPPASKKFKGSESQLNTSEPENLSKEAAMDESMDASTVPDGDGDGDNEETEAVEEKPEEESMEAQEESEAEIQDKADEPVEENPTETEAIPADEENQYLLADLEFDEEGEFDV